MCVNLAAKLLENDYLWQWTTRIEPLLGSSSSPVHFDQSQFAGAVLSAAQLRKIAADYIPELSDEAILRRRTFELMDGKLSLEGIAHRLAAEFPERFSNPQEALSYAGAVSQEYSR